MLYEVPTLTHLHLYTQDFHYRKSEEPHREACVIPQYCSEEPPEDHSVTSVGSTEWYNTKLLRCVRVFRTHL